MKQQPPKYALKFLRWFCKEDYLEEIEGNLFELFDQNVEESPQGAKRKFYWQVLLHFRPDFIKSFAFDNPLIYKDMFKHNLLISYRSFLRNKTSFLINLIGLSTGLACVLLIYLWVNDEVQINKFHEKDAQLFHVMKNFRSPNEVRTAEMTPILLANALVEEIPGVAQAVSVSSREENPKGLLSFDNNDVVVNGMFASENYFDVFSYPLLRGDRAQLLNHKNDIVISEGLAMKLFNSTDQVVGQTLHWKSRWFKQDFQVKGIFKIPPTNTTERFDFLFHIDLLLSLDEYSGKWNGDYARTYVVLKEGTDVEYFNTQIHAFLATKDAKRTNSTLFAQQYSKRYLYGHFEDGIQAGGRITYVKLFSLIALFILLIACINFMNLSTAQASRKMKEIGVKKTIGANRGILIAQFLSESMIMSFLSLTVALSLVNVLLPQFNQITAKTLQLNPDMGLIFTIISIVLIVGLVAGSYPAFYLSGFNPIGILKGMRTTTLGEQWIRKGLVVFQFTLSVIFIVAVLVVNEQMEYTQTKNLGFDRDNVMSFESRGHRDSAQVFLSMLKNIPGVVNVSNMAGSILDGQNNQSGYSWRGEETDKKYLFQSPIIGHNVIECLDMELLAGRSFSTNFKEEYNNIILNESARKMMELEDPIGQRIVYGKEERQIIGIVQDFNYGSIHQKVEPLIFRFGSWGSNIMTKVKAGTEQATIEKIQVLHQQFNPGYPFEFTFMDEDYQQLYEAESRVAVLSKYFSGLAIIISCLGLFGLAAFTAERRSKEIGIRKVLGSSVWGIVHLLSKDFTKMVLIAIGIALPISYWISQNWLAGFAYKIELEWWYFLIAALVTMLIAWLTVGLQTIKAARVNPVQFLKSE